MLPRRLREIAMSDTLRATTPVPPAKRKRPEPNDPRAVGDLIAAAKVAYAYLNVYAQLPRERYLPGEAAAGLALKGAIGRIEGRLPSELAPGEDFARLLADAWVGLEQVGRTPDRWDDEEIDYSDDPPDYDAQRPWQKFAHTDEASKT